MPLGHSPCGVIRAVLSLAAGSFAHNGGHPSVQEAPVRRQGLASGLSCPCLPGRGTGPAVSGLGWGWGTDLPLGLTRLQGQSGSFFCLNHQDRQDCGTHKKGFVFIKVIFSAKTNLESIQGDYLSTPDKLRPSESEGDVPGRFPEDSLQKSHTLLSKCGPQPPPVDFRKGSRHLTNDSGWGGWLAQADDS